MQLRIEYRLYLRDAGIGETLPRLCPLRLGIRHIEAIDRHSRQAHRSRRIKVSPPCLWRISFHPLPKKGANMFTRVVELALEHPCYSTSSDRGALKIAE